MKGRRDVMVRAGYGDEVAAGWFDLDDFGAKAEEKRRQKKVGTQRGK